jgi:hypothetical protein
MTDSFHTIWKKWHIYGVRNPRTWGDNDGLPHYLLDGIDDFIRPSMRLRGLSERRLRQRQVEEHWTNAELEEHLAGLNDGPDDHDEEVYGQLTYLDCESMAQLFIPEQSLVRIQSAVPPESNKRR